MIIKTLIVLFVIVAVLAIAFVLVQNNIRKKRLDEEKKRIEKHRIEKKNKELRRLELERIKRIEEKRIREQKEKEDELKRKIQEEDNFFKEYKKQYPEVRRYTTNVDKEIKFIHSFERCRNCIHIIPFDKDRRYNEDARGYCKLKKKKGDNTNQECIVNLNCHCPNFKYGN